MADWTPEREAEAEAWCHVPVFGFSEIHYRARQTNEDCLDAIRNGRRLEVELIAAWTHREYRCPCSDKQRDPDRIPAPWRECTCGLKEALHAPEGEGT